LITVFSNISRICAIPSLLVFLTGWPPRLLITGQSQIPISQILMARDCIPGRNLRGYAKFPAITSFARTTPLLTFAFLRTRFPGPPEKRLFDSHQPASLSSRLQPPDVTQKSLGFRVSPHTGLSSFLPTGSFSWSLFLGVVFMPWTPAITAVPLSTRASRAGFPRFFFRPFPF